MLDTGPQMRRTELSGDDADQQIRIQKHTIHDYGATNNRYSPNQLRAPLGGRLSKCHLGGWEDQGLDAQHEARFLSNANHGQRKSLFKVDERGQAHANSFASLRSDPPDSAYYSDSSSREEEYFWIKNRSGIERKVSGRELPLQLRRQFRARKHRDDDGIDDGQEGGEGESWQHGQSVVYLKPSSDSGAHLSPSEYESSNVLDQNHNSQRHLQYGNAACNSRSRGRDEGVYEREHESTGPPTQSKKQRYRVKDRMPPPPRQQHAFHDRLPLSSQRLSEATQYCDALNESNHFHVGISGLDATRPLFAKKSSNRAESRHRFHVARSKEQSALAVETPLMEEANDIASILSLSHPLNYDNDNGTFCSFEGADRSVFESHGGFQSIGEHRSNASEAKDDIAHNFSQHRHAGMSANGQAQQDHFGRPSRSDREARKHPRSRC